MPAEKALITGINPVVSAFFQIIGNSYDLKALRANDAQLRARNKSCAGKKMKLRSV